jgi:hypothetical protein
MSDTKTCNKCGKVKSTDEYYTRSGPNDRYRLYKTCKPCHNKRVRENHLNNQKAHRKATQKSRFKIKYDITLEDYTKIYQKQNGKCANPNCLYYGNLVVDHDHNTGKFRGLLCRKV